MVRRIFVVFLLTALLDGSIGCAGQKWISAETAAQEQQSRQRNANIIAAQTLTKKISFPPPFASYDREDRLLAGRTVDGELVCIPVDSIDRVFFRFSEEDTTSEPHALSKSMFTNRYKRASVEPILAARLIADTASPVIFAPQGGRVWVFDSTLSGRTLDGGDFRTTLNKISSVKVSRFSSGKTLLFVAALVAVTGGIIGIAFVSQDGFFQAKP